MSPRLLDLDQPRDLGGLLTATNRLWRSNLRLFLSIAAAVVVVVDVITGAAFGLLTAPYHQHVASNVATIRALLQTLIAMLVTTPLITAMNVRAVLELGAGRVPSWRQSINGGLELFAPVLVAVTIYLTGVLAGSLALVLPGIYIAVRWYFVTQAVVADGRRGLNAARRSSELVAGNWWRVLGIAVVINVIVGVPSGLASAGLDELAHSADAQLVNVIGGMAVQCFSLSYLALAGTLLYFDLRARREPRNPERPAGGPVRDGR